MKTKLIVSTGVLALVAGGAFAQDLKFPVGEGAFNWDSYKAYDEATNLEGQSITMFGPWRGEDQVLVETMLAYFTAASGVTVNYSSSENYEQQIVIDTQAGSPPDIAILPQPGLIADLASKGFITPLGADTETWLRENYAAGESWVGLGTYAGADGTDALYAFPYKIDVKSLVWYSPDNFEDAGYTVPETMEDLKALQDQIVADGGTPWCIGLGSGGATGWPATDWVEDLMLRTQPPEVYDQWVTNEIPFNDPAVATALAEVGKILKNDKYVNGGQGDVKTIASTSFQDAGLALLDNGGCYLHRQASFYAANFPEGTEVAEDGDVWAFYLPAKDETTKPVLVGGEFTAAFADRPEVKAFQTYLASVEWANERAKTCGGGGCVTANTQTDVSLLKNPIDKLSAEILTDEASTSRFDGSDLMPGAVGSGTFWKGMTDWIIGQDDKATLDYIENSWPKS